MRHHDGFGRSSQIGACVGVALLGSLLAGCAPAYPIPRAPEGDPIQAAREFSDAPEAVRNGDAARTCGAFVLDQGERVPAEAVDCLSTALAAREEAELAWTFPTAEGDPIVHFAFVGETTDEVTVVVTNAFDSYGGDPSWTSSTCADVAAATSYVGCAGADVGAAVDFGSIARRTPRSTVY
jgi:hypothetical protein